VRFLDDSNSWHVNGTSNLRTLRQMLRVLSQLASGNVLAEPRVLDSVALTPLSVVLKT